MQHVWIRLSTYNESQKKEHTWVDMNTTFSSLLASFKYFYVHILRYNFFLVIRGPIWNTYSVTPLSTL